MKPLPAPTIEHSPRHSFVLIAHPFLFQILRPPSKSIIFLTPLVNPISLPNMDPTNSPHEIENCRNVLHVYSDGSIRRSPNPSFNVAVHDDGSVLWKDSIFDPTHNLGLRLYKPAQSPPSVKLPVFYYFHGGGYCIGSRTWPNCQNYCLRLARDLQAVVVAPDYRLAPENRLPAAIEDGVAALSWLKEQAASEVADMWLTEVANFAKVFVSGDSAGGNIAHHLAVRFGSKVGPVRIRGYVYLAPFFGGIERTRSEAECPKDAFLPLELNDRFWRLSLPVGANRDDPLSSPLGPANPSLESAALGPILVVVGSADLLRDRAAEYVSKLKDWGKKVELVEFPGLQHGFFTIDPFSDASDKLMRLIKQFISENSDSD